MKTLKEVCDEIVHNKSRNPKYRFLLLFLILDQIEKDAIELTGERHLQVEAEVKRLVGQHAKDIFDIENEELFVGRLDDFINRFYPDFKKEGLSTSERSKATDYTSWNGFISSYSKIYDMDKKIFERRYRLFIFCKNLINVTLFIAFLYFSVPCLDMILGSIKQQYLIYFQETWILQLSLFILGVCTIILFPVMYFVIIDRAQHFLRRFIVNRK
jgi:hypothetical protein